MRVGQCGCLGLGKKSFLGGFSLLWRDFGIFLGLRMGIVEWRGDFARVLKGPLGRDGCGGGVRVFRGRFQRFFADAPAGGAYGCAANLWLDSRKELTGSPRHWCGCRSAWDRVCAIIGDARRRWPEIEWVNDCVSNQYRERYDHCESGGEGVHGAAIRAVSCRASWFLLELHLLVVLAGVARARGKAGTRPILARSG